MTMNITLLLVVFLSAVSIGTPPFSVIQLLWMNIIMDTLAAIALCTEPFVPAPDDDKEKNA
jgi:Ca2+-transporting ATPase